jgi:hypothetical protein
LAHAILPMSLKLNIFGASSPDFMYIQKKDLAASLVQIRTLVGHGHGFVGSDQNKIVSYPH